jgi:hypothetical protein
MKLEASLSDMRALNHMTHTRYSRCGHKCRRSTHLLTGELIKDCLEGALRNGIFLHAEL